MPNSLCVTVNICIAFNVLQTLFCEKC